MPVENVQGRKEKGRYTFVVLPSEGSKKTRTFSIKAWEIISGLAFSFVVIATSVIGIMIYTPMRDYLPVSNSKLEERYGNQIVEIQNQVDKLLHELETLRMYNTRLRNILGEKMPSEDTTRNSGIESTTRDQQMATRSMSRSREVFEQPVEITKELPLSEEQRNALTPAGRNLQSEDSSINFPLTVPADGYMTRGFDPLRNHFGIDIAGKQGSAVLSSADGNVVFANWTYDDGFMMIIAHSRTYMTVYKHNQMLLKNVGAMVKRGEIIALLGNTGATSTGPHLHFEVWRDGVATDPNNYLLVTQ